MGQQLDLFTRLVSPPAPPSPPGEEPPPALPPLEVLPGQMGLFDLRSVVLSRARTAVAEGRLGEARRELDALCARSPGDVDAAREAAEARDLEARLARIDAPRARNRARALLAFARDLDAAVDPKASLQRHLLKRVAMELRRKHGDTGELEGRLAGEFLMDAGELEQAEESLGAAATALRSSRPLFVLAEAALLRGDATAARRRYLTALLVDPFDPALLAARDEAVRALPDVARDEMELQTEPAAWAAPAGILTGVLPWPAAALVASFDDSAMAPSRREELQRARSFVDALAASGAARGEATIEARRRMKRISPEMFAAYMSRVVRGAR